MTPLRTYSPDEARELAKAERAAADSGGRPSPDQAKRLADRTDQLAKDIAVLKDRLQHERADTAARVSPAVHHGDPLDAVICITPEGSGFEQALAGRSVPRNAFGASLSMTGSPAAGRTLSWISPPGPCVA